MAPVKAVLLVSVRAKVNAEPALRNGNPRKLLLAVSAPLNS
jgi:hypothetical protein